MAFQDKDLKILWGKAAGRCSMPECRIELVELASDAVPSKRVLKGENCHIVADKSNGPRGASTLSVKDRNRYPNLILLCANHHTVVDQDPSSWPIERLHQIKSDHEIWVETQLTMAPEPSEAARYYSDFVNRATSQLLLSHWDSVSDHAFRSIVFEEFVDGINAFHEMTTRAIWPSGFEEVKIAALNLSERLHQYLTQFMRLAIFVERKKGSVGVFREDKSWKKSWKDDYDDYAQRSKEWEDRCIKMLTNVVVALNEFANAIRTKLNPRYFLYEGKFILSDTMGISTDGFTPAYYIPDKYVAVEE